MKKYFLIGGSIAFIAIFNLGYVFHEILTADLFRSLIGSIQRESYIIPFIAIAFILYTAFQAYGLHVFYEFASRHYRWGLTKAAIVFGMTIGFVWDSLQGGIIEVATFKMPLTIFWYDSTYHTVEGIIMALILSFFYKRFVLLKHS